MSEEKCSYCGESLTTTHTFSYGVSGIPRIYGCNRANCIANRGESLLPRVRELEAERDALRKQLGATSAYSSVAVIEENTKIKAELEALKKNYNELLYQVQNKIPNETRHETAKRIIHQHETRPSNPTGDK